MPVTWPALWTPTHVRKNSLKVRTSGRFKLFMAGIHLDLSMNYLSCEVDAELKESGEATKISS